MSHLTDEPGNYYETSAPSKQAAIDIFRGDWISELPDDLVGGEAQLFADGRLEWGGAQLDVAGSNVLELGPLEGGHSYMLQRMGAARVVAVEANPRAYLKCLVVKETLQLGRVEFLYGDFVEYLRQGRRFDVCVASGVLYHMRDPIELLHLLAAVTDRMFLWTHYYDVDLIAANPNAAAHFPSDQGPPFRYEYDSVRETAVFAGGNDRYSHWLDRATIVRTLADLGFDVTVGLEEPNHPNGPALALVATRP